MENIGTVMARIHPADGLLRIGDMLVALVQENKKIRDSARELEKFVTEKLIQWASVEWVVRNGPREEDPKKFGFDGAGVLFPTLYLCAIERIEKFGLPDANVLEKAIRATKKAISEFDPNVLGNLMVEATKISNRDPSFLDVLATAKNNLLKIERPLDFQVMNYDRVMLSDQTAKGGEATERARGWQFCIEATDPSGVVTRECYAIPCWLAWLGIIALILLFLF